MSQVPRQGSAVREWLVIGAIVEVKSDTVVLKVDESSNTRMTFSRDAVQQVLESSESSESSSS